VRRLVGALGFVVVVVFQKEVQLDLDRDCLVDDDVQQPSHTGEDVFVISSLVQWKCEVS
jgi:hypothetical protein